MPRRLLHFRITFAVLGLGALLGGAWLGHAWLAGPGVCAAAVSDLIGISLARARFPLPADRTLRGAAEALPALGVAAFEPLAIGITVVVIIHALMAAGVQTVSVARGVNLTSTGAETMRRVVTSLASMAALSVPLAVTTRWSLPRLLQMPGWMMVVCLFALVTLAGFVALGVMWWSVRSGGKSGLAQNVDT
jgi:hypothetical protein